MKNDKGMVLCLVVVFVLIFSVLGLHSLRLSIMHNTDVNKELTMARTYYAAESALERAAFRMALFAKPISGADVLTAQTSGFAPETGTEAEVWYFDYATNKSTNIIITRNSSGKWFPLGTGNVWMGDGLSPDIDVRVSAEIEKNPVNADGIIISKIGTSGSIFYLKGGIINFSSTTVSPKSPFCRGYDRVAFRVDITSIAIAWDSITFYVNAANTGEIGNDGNIKKVVALNDHKKLVNDYWYDTVLLNTTDSNIANSLVHLLPPLFRMFYKTLVEIGEGGVIPIDVKHYVINSTATAINAGASMPSVNLRFHYSVVQNLNASGFERLMDKVDAPKYFSPGQASSTKIPFSKVGLKDLTSSEIAGNTEFKNIFRGRR